MAQKITTYVGEPMAALLGGWDDQRSARLNQVCADYRDVVREHMPALTRAEWCAVMDATNGLFATNDAGATRRFVWAEIEDCEGLGEKWEVNQTALARQVRRMSTVELVALIEASRVFWSHSELPSAEAMTRSGCRIASDDPLQADVDRGMREPDASD
jgi:hypothetical protein